MINNVIQIFRAVILGCFAVVAVAISLGLLFAVLKGIWKGLHD